ncbi:MAG: GH3 auxin-responsive promoter family protein [Gemmatales bacterium]|nr:GH3 auxin-responsive promoter family protein [Gemmatales bacterium]
MLWDSLTRWSLIRRGVQAALRTYALRRLARLDRADACAEQEATLLRLVHQASATRFGQEHGFAGIRCVRDFQERVPLRTYEDFWRQYWQPTFPHLQGITWPAAPSYFALSSGTSTGNTKYLPLTKDLLASNRSAALCLFGSLWASYPHIQLLHGRLFFLGGSTDLTLVGPGIYAGDLSGIVAATSPSWLRPFSWPPLSLALLKDWDKKITELARTSLRERITLLAGVPSWLMVLIEELKKAAGGKALVEIWPDLQVVVHGGVCFEPYRAWFARELPNHVLLAETYPSSEAFIAFEDLRYRQLRLITDHGIFFEFVPREELGQARATRHTVHNFELNVDYAVVVTTCAGLWAYMLGDVIRFIQRDPPLLRFVGRTSYFLSAFGEHLTGEEIERAVSHAAQLCQALVADFHVGPVFRQRGLSPGWHRYLVECVQPPSDLAQFARALDTELRQLNADYDVHRTDQVGMGPPEVILLRRGAFTDWLRSQGKLGGQHKVPRIDNSGQITASLSQFFADSGAIMGATLGSDIESNFDGCPTSVVGRTR